MDQESEMIEKPGLGRRIGKRLLRMLWSLAFIVGTVSLFLVFYQHKMIYFPRAYDQEDFLGAPESMVELEFTTSQGPQVAFYIPPRGGSDDELPKSIWAAFSGNASSAMDWRFFAKDYPGENTGFLLVDYPGYGKSEGSPRPARILENSIGAVKALEEHLGAESGALDERTNVIGHSLGAAAALQHAAVRPVNGAVLISPFTSMRAMAFRTAGPFGFVLHHNYDNRARLAVLDARDPKPNVTIIHGDNDEIVPFSMGKKLSEEFSDLIEFRPMKGGDHNAIMDFFEKDIYQAMLETEKRLIE